MKSINFLIYAPSTEDPSGGQIVLYALNDYLNSIGHNSKLVIFGTRIKYNTHNTVVIYPEIIPGNPLNSKHTVRWLLNTPGVITGKSQESTWHSKDLVYRFSKSFNCKRKIDGILRIVDYKLDFFTNDKKERNLECVYLVYKGNRFFKEFNQHPRNAPKIDDHRKNLALMKEIFNKTNFLISYDNASYFNIAAALCGCNVIVIPDKNISQEEWGSTEPTMKYGVAYGYNNLKHALETKKNVKEYLQTLKQKDEETIQEFIKDCLNNFNI